MRNLKKILAMALTVLMVVGSFAMTATAAFDDVTDYQEAIEVMAALGIAAGKSETEFAPDDDVTREEMALWIAKIMTGKVASDYVTNNFLGSVENLTAFADIDETNYVGAINYAANNGIIVGTSATTFEASEAIKVQDVFAMVVRMLGYGSTAMNNNYPWSFIDKAISLGLDAGLPADYSNEAVASRGETMQILYNALTALKSDGSTLGYDFFGLEKATVVITGTSKGNMYTGAELVTKTVDGEDFVSFSILNANGTVASDKATYYILKSAFGIEGNAQFSVGNSYVVRTIDGFGSFLTVEECDSVVVDQDVIVGGTSTSASQEKYVTVDGTKFELVEAFSDFVTVNEDEIIFLNPAGYRTEVYDSGSYVMDSNLNILADDDLGPNGDGILLHWVTTYGVDIDGVAYANLNGMYLYQIGTDANGEPIYIQPNDYIWSQAKKHRVDLGTDFGFQSIMKSYSDIEKKDAYSDTVLYDDDADGIYDRAIYFQYKFGNISNGTDYGNNGYTKYVGLKVNNAFIHEEDASGLRPDYKTATYYYDADGNELSYDDIAGKYVLYCYIPLYKTMIVKEIFEAQTGLVTGVDLVTKTLTLNAFGANIITGVVSGETYTIGNEKLSGAEYTTLRARNNLLDTALYETIGKNINFIEKDGKILAICNATDDAKHMVVVNANAGYTTMGYSNILAYYNAASSAIAATQSVVTVNAVNNYWYSGLISGTTAATAFNTGDLLAATKDSLGNYDVTLVTKDALSTRTSYAYVDEDATTTPQIKVDNGVIYATDDVKGFTTFKASSATVWIVLNDDDQDGMYEASEFKTYTGIPTSGAAIDLNEDSEIFYEKNASGYENFIYVKNATFSSFSTGATNSPWENNVQTTTIVYVDVDTVQTMKADNALTYGIGVLTGGYYHYDKAIDVINGGFETAIYSDYNFGRLTAGKFYLVQNGRVMEEIDLTKSTSPIKLGKLTEIHKDNSYDVVVYENAATKTDGNKDIDEKNAFPILYWNTATANTWNTSGNAALIDVMVDKGAKTSTKATSLAKFNAINDDPADGDDYVEVYYYDVEETINGYTFPSYNKMPVFIMTTGYGTLAIPEGPQTTYKYNVQLYALDATTNGTHTATMMAQNYKSHNNGNVTSGVDFYFGGKNGETILFNGFEKINMYKNYVPGSFYCYNYAVVDSTDDLPIIIFAVDNAFDEKYDWDIAFTKQGGAAVRYDSSVTLKEELVEILGTNYTNAGVTYYALQVTDEMIRYKADMTVADLDGSTLGVEYDIDVCFWVVGLKAAQNP